MKIAMMKNGEIASIVATINGSKVESKDAKIKAMLERAIAKNVTQVRYAENDSHGTIYEKTQQVSFAEDPEKFIRETLANQAAPLVVVE